MRRGERTAGYKISYKIQLIKSCKTHTHTHGERHMVGCVLQLRKLPWKWAWQDFFCLLVPNVAWGLPVDAFRWRSQKVQLKAQQCAPQDIQVGRGSSTNHPPSHHSTIRSAGHKSNSSSFSSLSPIQRVMRIRITCLCALTEWHTWIGLVGGQWAETEGGGYPSPSHQHHHHHHCFSGFGSVISLPHTAFTDEPKCISLLTVVANLRWVFHSKQIAPARIKCAHTNCHRTCQKTQLWM